MKLIGTFQLATSNADFQQAKQRPWHQLGLIQDSNTATSSIIYGITALFAVYYTNLG